MRTKTRTVPLHRRDYIWGAGEVNITRLVEDAVCQLMAIEATGVGLQKRRSRGVVFRSFCRVLVSTHWTEPEAWRMWRQQVLPIFALESAADDEF